MGSPPISFHAALDDAAAQRGPVPRDRSTLRLVITGFDVDGAVTAP
jgi:hypothetical protein